ncbi:MAG: PilZ domain-containing protein [Magnetococcales bacterium]|nr:PilZ domain-containing protein [Magnetococcales bacterium]
MITRHDPTQLKKAFGRSEEEGEREEPALTAHRPQDGKRRFPRERYDTPLTFIPNNRSRRIHGSSQDVSICGVFLQADAERCKNVQDGDTGTLIFMDEGQEHTFPCRIIRKKEDGLALEIDRHDISRFGSIITKSIFNTMSSELDLVKQWEKSKG